MTDHPYPALPAGFTAGEPPIGPPAEVIVWDPDEGTGQALVVWRAEWQDFVLADDPDAIVNPIVGWRAAPIVVAPVVVALSHDVCLIGEAA